MLGSEPLFSIRLSSVLDYIDQAVARRIRAGQCAINGGGPNHEAPFGGYKESDIMPEPLAPLTSNQECELLIAGGGFTGLWAAMQAQF